MEVKARDIPNLICIMRILLVFPTIFAMLTERFGWALTLFMIAAVSDGLDGYLARRFDWRSRLGSFLDPLADKFLMVSVYITCAWMGLIPLWFVGIVILRDIVIITGAVLFHRKFGSYTGEPLWSSKLNTVIQLVLATILLANQSIFPVENSLIELLIFFALLTTLWSGFSYVYIWKQKGKKTELEP